jgi:hypothetical protein
MEYVLPRLHEILSLTFALTLAQRRNFKTRLGCRPRVELLAGVVTGSSDPPRFVCAPLLGADAPRRLRAYSTDQSRDRAACREQPLSTSSQRVSRTEVDNRNELPVEIPELIWSKPFDSP